MADLNDARDKDIDTIYDYNPDLMYRRGMYVNREDILYRNIHCEERLYITALTEDCLWEYGQTFKIVKFFPKDSDLPLRTRDGFDIPKELITEKEDGFIVHIGYVVNSILTYFDLFHYLAGWREMIYHKDRIYQRGKDLHYVRVELEKYNHQKILSYVYNAPAHDTDYLVLAGSLVDNVVVAESGYEAGDAKPHTIRYIKKDIKITASEAYEK